MNFRATPIKTDFPELKSATPVRKVLTVPSGPSFATEQRAMLKEMQNQF